MARLHPRYRIIFYFRGQVPAVGGLELGIFEQSSTAEARKVREAKLTAGHAKRKVQAAGRAAKAHVTRNRAAYIAGGAGLAGSAALSRRKKD